MCTHLIIKTKPFNEKKILYNITKYYNKNRYKK